MFINESDYYQWYVQIEMSQMWVRMAIQGQIMHRHMPKLPFKGHSGEEGWEEGLNLDPSC